MGSGFLRGVPEYAGLRLNLAVDPDLRRHRIGTRLLEALLDATDAPGLETWTFRSEDDAGTRAFLEHHGFEERDREFESALDLVTFDPAAFAVTRAQAIGRGIRFVRFTEVDTPALRHRLHRLANRLNRDVPAVSPLVPATYEQWVAGWLESPHSRPDLFVVAFDGDRPVAVSAIDVVPEGTAYNRMTGVAASHRGRGLGVAVKVESLRLAKEAGITEVRTDNHARNAPMLAVNARLGYRPLLGFVEMVRRGRALPNP